MIEHRQSSPRKPKRVVIAGASGFVGTDLCAKLQGDGVKVVPLSSTDLDLCNSGSVEKLQGLMETDDVVVFVSARTPDKGKDIHTLMSNLAMGENFCAALSKQACKQVVYVSSDAVYADDANPIREDSCCHPSGYHGIMHLAREAMLRETCSAAKIPLFILRPSLLFGAGDTHNGYGPNRFMRLAQSGEDIKVFGDGEEKRDHVYVPDLTELTHAGIGHCSEGVLNVATGQSHSFHDVATAAIAQLGSKSQIAPQPRSTTITHRHFDVTEIHKTFPGFSITSLETGLEMMAGGLDR
jgi:UDP-glucose 4-epimerase